MNRIWTLILIIASIIIADDFEIRMSHDAFEGEAQLLLEMQNASSSELINIEFSGESSKGRVRFYSDLKTSEKVLHIETEPHTRYRIWLQNPMMSDYYVSDKDLMAIANSKPVFQIHNKTSNHIQSISVPEVKGQFCHVFNIVSDEIQILNEFFSKPRLLRIQFLHAVTGKSIEAVTGQFTNPSAASQQNFSSDSKGFWEVQLDHGSHQLEFHKDAFVPVHLDVKFFNNELPIVRRIALSPKIKEYRIVLTWGEHPRDLDAHLLGPKPEGGRFHIWWNHKTLIGGKNFLDRDDTSAFGPETISIYKPARGEYQYFVHNYSGKNTRNNTSLSYSAAHVDVFAGGKLIQQFDIPNSQKGNAWQVFNLDENMSIIPINKIFDTASSSTINE